MADKKADAVKAKTEGNKHFKAKNYEKAIESYTKAVELDPDKVIIGVLRESFLSSKVLKPPSFFRHFSVWTNSCDMRLTECSIRAIR